MNVEGGREGVSRAMVAVGQASGTHPSLLYISLGIATSNPTATAIRASKQAAPRLGFLAGVWGGPQSPSLTPSSPCPSLPSTDGIYYGDNRFNTVSESGTATLKARPRVRPLLTFIPLVSKLSAQASSLFRVRHLTCRKRSGSATPASPTVHSLPS